MSDRCGPFLRAGFCRGRVQSKGMCIVEWRTVEGDTRDKLHQMKVLPVPAGIHIILKVCVKGDPSGLSI